MPIIRNLIGISLILWHMHAAHAAEVTTMRVWVAPDHTRFVFDLSSAVQQRVFTLAPRGGKPDRVVLDINHTRINTALPSASLERSVVRAIRTGRRGQNARIVFDLKAAAGVNSFLLKPYAEYGHRLVVDIQHGEWSATPLDTPRAWNEQAKNNPETRKDAVTANPLDLQDVVADRSRERVIVIDPGHGGEDPGAKGLLGTEEKDVALNVGLQLARLIEARPGTRAVLTRHGDYFLSLRQRTDIARRHKADLFVSIHVDSGRNPSARGASVYVLSEKGASDEAARWLARKENAADLAGGVNIKDRDDLVAQVILDLSQTATLRESRTAAERVLYSLGKVQPLHAESVKHAPFAVLKAPDIPSLLVETAFISNGRDERRLRNADYQLRMAKAIDQGIAHYFAGQAPEPSLMRHHVIAQGETLSSIAEHYAVSPSILRKTNGLTSDAVVPGQILRIPYGGDS